MHFAADGLGGWAVGERGTIVVSVDGGKTWDARSSGVTNHLMSVHLTADGSRGWAVGFGGTIIVSVDGGKTWDAWASGTTNTLLSVHFADDGLRGWSVGERGTLVATADGGRSWVAQTRNVFPILTSVHFSADGRRGWAVGFDGFRLTFDPPDLSSFGQAKTLDELRKLLKVADIDEAQLGDPFATYRALDANRAALQTQYETLETDIKRLNSDLGINTQSPTEQSSPTGTASQTNPPKDFDWDKVFNLIARFAVVSVVLFLVGILVSIYRYTARLAAHYDARADALGLAEAILPKDFHRLAETLAPGRLDFGKAEAAPTNKLLDLAVLALRRGR